MFSLRGKPLNCFGLTKKVVYENEEFNLLQHALNIEDGLDGLRYKNIVIATDADVDGMHIRLLLMTFFLQFFPDLVKKEHVFVLETPLFRVRDKKETIYCYDENEKQAAIKKLGGKPEITRFKGLGEISPDEFGRFIGTEMKLQAVILEHGVAVEVRRFVAIEACRPGPGTIAQAHKPDEHIVLSDYLAAIEHLIDFIPHWCNADV